MTATTISADSFRIFYRLQSPVSDRLMDGLRNHWSSSKNWTKRNLFYLLLCLLVWSITTLLTITLEKQTQISRFQFKKLTSCSWDFLGTFLYKKSCTQATFFNQKFITGLLVECGKKWKIVRKILPNSAGNSAEKSEIVRENAK